TSPSRHGPHTHCRTHSPEHHSNAPGEPHKPHNHGSYMDSQFTEYRFLASEYVASAFADGTGRVVIYSVMTCSPDFGLTFTTPIGTRATLQTVPIANTEQGSPGDKAAAYFDYNERFITYYAGATRGSLNQIIEEGKYSGSTIARYQSFYVGVNSACAKINLISDPSSTEALWVQNTYSGYTDKAPETLKALRGSIAANFYAETSGIDIRISSEDKVLLYNGNDPIHTNEEQAFPISPYHLDLPQNYLQSASTRTFQ
ncbi:hypothetical protein, partial [Arthrobacter sp. E3]|uniref:hypothetical protein n=1 Tax=Arthrobacter sp. E3 TaxID=517402 RepID=UPI001A94CE29